MHNTIVSVQTFLRQNIIKIDGVEGVDERVDQVERWGGLDRCGGGMKEQRCGWDGAIY